MKKIVLKVILVMALILIMFNLNTYAVSMNVNKANDKALSISLTTNERYSKSNFSKL